MISTDNQNSGIQMIYESTAGIPYKDAELQKCHDELKRFYEVVTRAIWTEHPERELVVGRYPEQMEERFEEKDAEISELKARIDTLQKALQQWMEAGMKAGYVFGVGRESFTVEHNPKLASSLYETTKQTEQRRGLSTRQKRNGEKETGKKK